MRPGVCELQKHNFMDFCLREVMLVHHKVFMKLRSPVNSRSSNAFGCGPSVRQPARVAKPVRTKCSMHATARASSFLFAQKDQKIPKSAPAAGFPPHRGLSDRILDSQATPWFRLQDSAEFDVSRTCATALGVPRSRYRNMFAAGR